MNTTKKEGPKYNCNLYLKCPDDFISNYFNQKEGLFSSCLNESQRELTLFLSVRKYQILVQKLYEVFIINKSGKYHCL